MLSSFLRLLCLCGLLLVMGHAWAQDAPDQSNVATTPTNAGSSASCKPDPDFLGGAGSNAPGPIDPNVLIGGMAKGLAGTLDSVMQSANSNVGALVGLAKTSLMLATMTALTIALYAAFIESHGIDRVAAEVLRILIITGLVLTVILGWGQYASSIPDFFKSSVLGAFGVSATTDPVMILYKPIEVVIKFISNMWTWMEKGVSPCDDSSMSSWLNRFLDAVGIGVLLKLLARILVMALCILILAIPMIIFAGALLAMTFGTQIIIFIGMMFGPLMISMAPVRQMSWMVMSWVKFMLINSTTLAVAYVIALILTGGVQLFSQNVMSAGMGFGQSVVASLFAALAFAVVLIFFSYMVMQSGSIAQALFSGSAAQSGASGFAGGVGKALTSMRMGGKSNAAAAQQQQVLQDLRTTLQNLNNHLSSGSGGSGQTANTTGASVSNAAAQVSTGGKTKKP